MTYQLFLIVKHETSGHIFKRQVKYPCKEIPDIVHLVHSTNGQRFTGVTPLVYQLSCYVTQYVEQRIEIRGVPKQVSASNPQLYYIQNENKRTCLFFSEPDAYGLHRMLAWAMTPEAAQEYILSYDPELTFLRCEEEDFMDTNYQPRMLQNLTDCVVKQQMDIKELTRQVDQLVAYVAKLESNKHMPKDLAGIVQGYIHS